jgi:ribosomal protein S6--L-glutamate ligase
MAMRVGLLGWDHGEIDTDTPAFLAAGLGRGHAMSLFTLEEVSYTPARHGLEVMFGPDPARSFDAVISRAKLYGEDWADRVERLTLASNVPGVPIFDPVDAWVAGYSKFRTCQILGAAGIPVPPTRSCTSLADAEAACAQWGRIILKPSFGYSGTDVELIADPGAEAHLVDKLLQTYGTLVCQPYYPTEFGEFRLNVAGSAIAVAGRKLPPGGGWKCKTMLGSSFEEIEPSADLADLAVRATRALGLTVGGVDILPSPDGPVVLEVNPIPGGLMQLGEQARQRVLAGLFDWVETHTGS